MRLALAVIFHHVAKQLAVRRRRPDDSVGPGADSGADALVVRPAGRDDGIVREAPTDLGHDLRRLRAGGHVQDRRAVLDAVAAVCVGIGHRDHDRHIDAAADAVEDAARRRRVDDHTGRALHLGVHGEVHDALARRQPAADADEHRQVARHEQRLRDDRLRCERIDREHCVGVDIADDAQVGREHERLDALAKHHDAAALVDHARHAQRELAQRAVDRCGHLRRDVHVPRRRHLAVGSGGRIVPHPAELQRLMIDGGIGQDLRVLGHIKNEITIFAHSSTSLLFLGVYLDLCRRLCFTEGQKSLILPVDRNQSFVFD